MTRRELIAAIAEEAVHSQVTVATVLDALAAAVPAKLYDGEEITLPGIGKLVVTERSARTGRNMYTGEPINIPASRSVRLRPSKALRDVLNPAPPERAGPPRARSVA